jgi:hypothetical protein
MKVLQSSDMIVSCSLLFVFVNRAERCGLKNFSGPRRAIAADLQTFEKEHMKLLTM